MPSLWVTATLEDKSPKAKASSSTLHFVAEHDVIWHGISIWPVWASCHSSVPFQLLACPQPSCCRGRVGKRKPWGWGCASRELNHLCVINTVLATNPKDSFTGVAVKKVNSIPDGLSADKYIYSYKCIQYLDICTYIYTQNVCVVHSRGRGGTDEATSLGNTSKRAKFSFRSRACCWRWQFPQVQRGYSPQAAAQWAPSSSSALAHARE